MSGRVGTPVAFNPYFAGCRSRGVLDHIADRWTILIIGVMSHGEPVRFSDLLHHVDGISTKMLTKVLRSLVRDGLVLRTVHDAHPVRIEYSLTDLGLTLLAPLDAMRHWATEHAEQISATQLAFDTAQTNSEVTESR